MRTSFVQRRLNNYIPQAAGSFQCLNNNLIATDEAEMPYHLCLAGTWTSERLNLRGLLSMAGNEMGSVCAVLRPVSADVLVI